VNALAQKILMPGFAPEFHDVKGGPDRDA